MSMTAAASLAAGPTLQPARSSSDIADEIRAMVSVRFSYKTNRCELQQRELTIDVTSADDLPIRGGGYIVVCCDGCTCGAADGCVFHVPIRFMLAGVTEASARKVARYMIEDARDDDEGDNGLR